MHSRPKIRSLELICFWQQRLESAGLCLRLTETDPDICRKETIEEPMFRAGLGSEVDREVGGEVVVASHVNREKKHHRHHHHHHKHRHGEDRERERERGHRHHKY